MYLVLLEDFNLFLIIVSALIGIFISVIAQTFIEKTLGNIKTFIEIKSDDLKESSSLFGKACRSCSKLLRKVGSIFSFLTPKMNPALKNARFEYRIYNNNGVIEGHEAVISNIRISWLGHIHGVMIRSEGSKKTYFKGHLKNNNTYFIWEERYKEGDNFNNLTTYYTLPNDITEDVIGLSLEEKNGNIISSLSIITSKLTGYSTLKNLLSNIDATYYLDHLNIDVKNIDTRSNNFIN